MRWADKYLRIPYVDRGEGFDGCDCWGLLSLILFEERGIRISNHKDVAAGDLLAKARKMAKGAETDPEWVSVNALSEQPFDCVLMKGQVRIEGSVRSVPVHIGCVVIPGRLIHIEKETGVLVMDYRRNALIKNRVLGFYRHV